ncbi:hypothetical protein [Sphingobium bisphenolivorans]|uniref:hypothetical protein n=1 Tax=Sphingobium bisphenolivorans TaxID=1335760 RepID=UPI0003A51CE4|nr:hypothetical protein [Sphingobium bisphenolivorans]
MTAFLKSDLFLRFLGGFVVGTIGILALQPDTQPTLTSPAMAASTSAATAHSDDATL